MDMALFCSVLLLVVGVVEGVRGLWVWVRSPHQVLLTKPPDRQRVVVKHELLKHVVVELDERPDVEWRAK